MSHQSDHTAKDSDEWKGRSSRKRSRKRPWKIEYRYKARWWYTDAPPRFWTEWTKWSAYETQAKRDMAYEAKMKSEGTRAYRMGASSWQFRKVDP